LLKRLQVLDSFVKITLIYPLCVVWHWQCCGQQVPVALGFGFVALALVMVTLALVALLTYLTSGDI